MRAAVFGTGAAIAGAILYYAVIAITNFEIGIIAILIGYMVGYAVMRGAGGHGSLRYQLLALVLTYFAVGLAYMPLALKEAAEATSSKPAVEARNTATEPTAAEASATPAAPTFRGFLLFVATVVAITFALPVLVVVGSLPSGLISGLIMGIGMRQAWRMTAASQLTVSGPYRVGAAAGPPLT